MNQWYGTLVDLFNYLAQNLINETHFKLIPEWQAAFLNI